MPKNHSQHWCGTEECDQPWFPIGRAQTTEQSSSPAGISPQISQLIAQPMVITMDETAIVQDGHENEPQDKLTAR